VLLGRRQGDNNQLLALAEALGLPFEGKQLAFNWLQHFSVLRGNRLLYLTARSRRLLTPPWPDVVIGLGYDTMPIARRIRQMSGGRAHLVQLGNPRTRLDDIDLVITTPQYSLGNASNVLSLPFPVGNPARSATATAEERQWLSSMERPRRVIAVGGSTRQWQLDNCELDCCVRYLQAHASRHGGSVIAVTSRRTPQAVVRRLKNQLAGSNQACVLDFPCFGVLLAEADECYVTADSVSMLAEAILTGKPVGMIPIARSWRGKIGFWARRLLWDFPSHADLSAFWRYLFENRLVGTVYYPVASRVGDTVDAAASAVLDVIGISGPRVLPEADSSQTMARRSAAVSASGSPNAPSAQR
jgi:mitochondrial fission protein ELM1